MRPVDTYEDLGSEAFLDGIRLENCPYPENTLCACAWTSGWLISARANPEFSADSAEWIDIDGYIDDLSNRLYDTKYRHQKLIYRARKLAPDLETVESAIDLPRSQWPSKCYAVAKALFESGALAPLIAEFGPAHLTYGIYEGLISDNSIFSARPFARHGWIEFDTGLVIDPTLWVFTAAQPHIGVTDTTHYDLGAQRLRRTLGRRPIPSFNPEENVYTWDCNDPDVTALAHAALKEHSQVESDRQISFGQALYLGNLPLETLGVHASAFYRVFDRMGLAGLIPADLRNLAKDYENTHIQTFTL